MYVTWDTETTIVESFGRKANPFDERNHVVCSGFLYSEKGLEDRYEDNHMLRDNGKIIPTEPFEGCDLMIGQNIRFDLAYVWRDPRTIQFFKDGGRVWDIQYAEYLLSAQTKTWASMDQMAVRYKLPTKPDKIKEYWKAGICTTLIPLAEILPYQEHDVQTTKSIFLIQYKKAKALGMIDTIFAHMDGLMAFLEMEFNGLQINMENKEHDQKELEVELEILQKKLDIVLENNFPDLPFEFNWGSGKQLSALFFGGKIPYEERIPNGFAQKTIKTEMTDAFDEPIRFKSGPKKGQIRYQNFKVDDETRPKIKVLHKDFKFKRIAKPQEEWATKIPGVYSTDKDTIATLANRGSKLAELLKRYAKITKDLSTYFAPIAALLYPDGKIHHNLNVVQTITGRLSSSRPNLQNLPRGDKSKCKRMFVSRFGDDGVMIETDYSQLEVIVQAWYTRDTQMIIDVNSGVDFHCKRLAYKLSQPYEYVVNQCKVEYDPEMIKQRTAIKVFSFQRAYGAGAATISASTGLSIPVVKLLENDEKAMYPSIEEFDKEVIAQCEASRTWTPFFTDFREKQEKGYYQAPTGMRYCFQTYDMPKYMRAKVLKERRQLKDNSIPMTQFYTPHIKNYPVQGGGGEIVIAALGRLWREKFLASDNYGGKAFMVNTVHDCFWGDVHKDVRDQVVKDTEKVLTDIQGLFDIYYHGLKCPVVFRVETEVGPNMYEMEHYSC
ncbi:MAG: DNA polymerase [Nitrosopumilus sp.]